MTALSLIVKPDEKLKSVSALPLQSVAEELAFLRQSFRDLSAAYFGKIEGEISQLHDAVIADTESKKKLPASRLADLRDMLMLLRSMDVKPAKGKRRDLKKIENLVADLRDIAGRW